MCRYYDLLSFTWPLGSIFCTGTPIRTWFANFLLKGKKFYFLKDRCKLQLHTWRIYYTTKIQLTYELNGKLCTMVILLKSQKNFAILPYIISISTCSRFVQLLITLWPFRSTVWESVHEQEMENTFKQCNSVKNFFKKQYTKW